MIPYEEILMDCVRSDDRVVIMTAENRGHMRNIPPLLGDRFIDVGIAEMTMIGSAAGLAKSGRIVVTHALSSFITLRAFEFTRDDVAILGLPVVMVGMVPGFLSDGNGPTHQAIEDVALMRGLPNVGVYCPADEADMKIGLKQIILSGQPFYVRYSPNSSSIVHDQQFEIGKSETVFGDSSGPVDVTILTYGILLQNCYEAAHELRDGGHSVRVVNMRTLKPVDVDAILQAVRTSRLVVTVEDHFKIGGLYSIVAESMVENGIMNAVLPIALDGRWFTPGRLDEVLRVEGFTSDQIAERVRLALQQAPADMGVEYGQN